MLYSKCHSEYPPPQVAVKLVEEVNFFPCCSRDFRKSSDIHPSIHQPDKHPSSARESTTTTAVSSSVASRAGVAGRFCVKGESSGNSSETLELH